MSVMKITLGFLLLRDELAGCFQNMLSLFLFLNSNSRSHHHLGFLFPSSVFTSSNPSYSPTSITYFCVFFFSWLFRATPEAYGSSQTRGWVKRCSCKPMPQPCQTWATSVTYTTAHSNTGSFTHWAGLGDGTQVLMDTDPQQELLHCVFNNAPLSSLKLWTSPPASICLDPSLHFSHFLLRVLNSQLDGEAVWVTIFRYPPQ